MTLHFSPPTLDLVPLLRQAIKDGYQGPPSGIALNRPVDENFLHALLNPAAMALDAHGQKVERAPESFLWLHDGQTFLGTVNMRHKLTPQTELQGGHIGYAVHPAHYNKGYGTLLLRRGLAFMQQQLHLPRVLLTIDDDNHASIRIAEKCGAKLQDIIDHPYKPGTPHRRYWIDLDFAKMIAG